MNEFIGFLLFFIFACALVGLVGLFSGGSDCDRISEAGGKEPWRKP